jgi:hypothetical protein
MEPLKLKRYFCTSPIVSTLLLSLLNGFKRCHSFSYADDFFTPFLAHTGNVSNICVLVLLVSLSLSWEASDLKPENILLSKR